MKTIGEYLSSQFIFSVDDLKVKCIFFRGDKAKKSTEREWFAMPFGVVC